MFDLINKVDTHIVFLTVTSLNIHLTDFPTFLEIFDKLLKKNISENCLIFKKKHYIPIDG